MALPLVVLASSIATIVGFGAKKGIDGYLDKNKAEELFKKAEAKYNNAREQLESTASFTSKRLDKLGRLQLDIGQDFAKFRLLADELLAKLNSSSQHHHKEFNVNLTKHELDEIKQLELSTTTYLAQIVGAGVVGGAAAYATYGGVMALAAASTGTPIATLSGAAAYKATLAAIGGGPLATGGMGMAGGTVVLGGIVLAPVIAVAGWSYANYAEKSLEQAREAYLESAKATEKLNEAEEQCLRICEYTQKIYSSINSIYSVFSNYFTTLKEINIYLEQGKNIDELADQIIQAIDNGYKIAAILTDIITTPLFKVKTDADGKVVLGQDNAVILETDRDGNKVINEEGINQTLNNASNSISDLQS